MKPKKVYRGNDRKEEGNLFPQIKQVDESSETIKDKNLTRKNEFQDISFEIKKENCRSCRLGWSQEEVN